MSLLARIFRAERIKLRRSWPLLAAILTPLTSTGFLFVVFWFSFDLVKPQGSGFQTWYQINFLAWNLFLAPTLVALLGVLGWEMEEEAGAWKLLLLQPVPRYSHYAARALGLGSLVLLANLVFLTAVLLGGLGLRAGVPHLRMGAVNPGILLKLFAASYLASISIVALFLWLPTRLHGMGINLVITIIGAMFAFRIAGHSLFGMIIPWSGCSQIVGIFMDEKGSLLRVTLEVVASTFLFGGIGLLDTLGRDEPSNSGGL